jgi:hypothetical protein
MARAWRNDIDLGRLDGVAEQVLAALPGAGDLVLRDSNRRVPYETGDLMRSGRVTRSGEAEVAVTYTDRGAVDAHERMEVPAANGRERKYLENALNATRDEVLAHLAAASGIR